MKPLNDVNTNPTNDKLAQVNKTMKRSDATGKSKSQISRGQDVEISKEKDTSQSKRKTGNKQEKEAENVEKESESMK